MANINNTPKTKFTNAEWFSFCLLIINYITSSEIPTTKFEKEFNTFKDVHKEYDGSLNKITRKQYWAKARSLKAKILNAKTGLLNMIKGETTSLVPEKVDAAAVLFIIMKEYSKMGRVKYNDVINMLNSLIQQLEKEENKVLIEKLNLADRIAGLKTLYEDALKNEDQLYKDEGLNKRKRKSYITRRELNKAYEILVKRLNALAIIEGDTDYLELFAWWNAMIDRYRVMISTRLGAGKGGSTDDGESSQHDPNSGSSGNEDDRPVIE